MEFQDAQNKVREFDRKRGWEDHWNIKDLCLNINEEIGELWDLIKWLPDEEQRNVLKSKHDLAEDFIGDVLHIVFKLANQMNVQADHALLRTLNEYEVRMPPDKMKNHKHANRHAGGYDSKNEL